MADYIDREALGLTDFEIIMCNGDYKELLSTVLKKIENAPSVDVVEVKHGHWIKTVYSGYKCEICGHIEDVVDEFEQPLYEDFADFCENNRYRRICGAKMRGLKE